MTALALCVAALTSAPCVARPGRPAAPSGTSDVRRQTSDAPPAPPRDPSTERAMGAFQRVDGADALLRAGRPGLAWAGYLAILKDFPTWWLPMLKAAVAARELGQGPEEVDARVDRAARLSPPGGPLSLVQTALAIDEGRLQDAVLPLNAAAEASGVADRIALLRGDALSRLGRHDAAIQEYRAILARTPGCAVARWRMARELAATGRADDATAVVREGASTSLFPPRWRAASGTSDRGTRGRDR